MTKIKPLISVVIPTYNLISDLLEAIDSIIKQDYSPIEIIVVDNGSTNGTSEKIKRLYPKIKLITHKKNLGVTGGRNSGLRKAEGKYILFFDHDMIADKEMVSELVKIVDSNEEISISTGKIYYWDDKKIIWSAGTDVNLITGQVLFRAGQDKGQYDCIEEIQVTPAVILVKKEVVEKIGGFDDVFFANWEDTDFCFRARKAGFKIFYTPKAIAYHKITLDPVESMNRLLSRAYYIARNRIIFMKRHSKHFYLFLLFLPGYLAYYSWLSLRVCRIDGIKNFLRGTCVGLYEVFKNKGIVLKTIGETAKCPLCDITEQIGIFCTVRNPRKIGEEKYNYVKCKRCGLVFLNPMPTREELDRIYTNIYDHYEEESNTFLNKIANLFSKPRTQYVEETRKSPGRILDIGCGTGLFLSKMKEKRWDIYGIEATKWAAERSAVRTGREKIFTKELHKICFPNNYFDVITLWHVLEHIKDVNMLIKEINRVLGEGGSLFIEVPNLNSVSLGLFQHNYSFLSVPEHILYWSESSLKNFLQNSGFSVKKVSYPFMIPLTFSRSLSNYFSNLLNFSFATRIVFFLSLPLSIVITLIACRLGKGEILRVHARKITK
jgi:GT2 family glycosyltransferase/2-polyprenyl-3-methyl-5-hydroxy-6-metoxy-1,4-benzoquinol methylase